MPLVSVIVPAWNAAEYIGAAIDSVLDQTFNDRELIVVDDGSPDSADLERVLSRYGVRADLRYVCQANGGPSAARNAGIALAHGEYLAFLDADDWWDPGYLSAQMGQFADNPGMDLVYCDAWLVGRSPHAGRSFMEVTPSDGPVTLESLISVRCNIPTTCTVARKRAVIDAGGFDPRFRRSEDFDLWARMSLRGSRMTYHRQVLANHRIHPDSAVADHVALYQDQLAVYRKLAALLTPAHAAAPLLDRQIERAEADLALALSKRHLMAREYADAARALAAARRYYTSPKLALAWVGLQAAPGLVRRWLGLRSLPS
jgi:glycosyltransferase involved in cell wall biosynthesis